MTPRTVLLPKSAVMVLLASFFTLAFIITPYWRRAETPLQMIFILALTIAVGIVWLLVSADQLQLTIELKRWHFFVVLFAVLVLINSRSLTSVIPWRGDEDYHIENTLLLASQISTRWLPAFGMVLLGLLYAAWRKAGWAVVAGLMLLSGIILASIRGNPLPGVSDNALFRYPYVNYWFFAIPPRLAFSLHITPYQEILFRILPFMAGAALVWTCQMYFLPVKKYPDLLWGCAVATIPLLFYYSSILYLELPAVLLMVIVCINIRSFLQDDFPQIKQKPFWYALLLIGFIKETAVLFLLCFVGWRFAGHLVRGRNLSNRNHPSVPALVQELSMSLAVLLPAVLYLFLRSFQTKNRSFTPEGISLANPTVLQAIGKSFTEQIGVFLFLFLAGCIILLLRREYRVAGFSLSLFLLYPLFFAVDTERYAGYSRFNLLILPPVLAASGWAIKEVLNRSRIAGLALAGIVILGNLWASPINWDGTKKPYWGNYIADTSEHYYPYNEALQWLEENHAGDRILLTGMYYPYRSFSFYFGQLDWDPRSEVFLTDRPENLTGSLTQALAKARAENFDVVLYQVTDDENLPAPDSLGFTQEKVFQNDAHMLIVYLRIR